jgi:hypothetical protein
VLVVDVAQAVVTDVVVTVTVVVVRKSTCAGETDCAGGRLSHCVVVPAQRPELNVAPRS